MLRSTCTMLLLFLVAMARRALGIGLPGGWGACPSPPVVEDFDVNSYTGRWFEYQRFPVPFEIAVKCGQAHYNIINSTAISVNNTGVREVKIAGRTLSKYRTSASGVAVMPDPEVPAKLLVSFGGQIVSYFAKGNYWVLDTDYNTYALVYSCSALPLNVAHYDAAWILTREQGVAPSNLQALRDILSNNGVNPDHFFTVEQSDCSVPSDPLHYVRGLAANVGPEG